MIRKTTSKPANPDQVKKGDAAHQGPDAIFLLFLPDPFFRKSVTPFYFLVDSQEKHHQPLPYKDQPLLPSLAQLELKFLHQP